MYNRLSPPFGTVLLSCVLIACDGPSLEQTQNCPVERYGGSAHTAFSMS